MSCMYRLSFVLCGVFLLSCGGSSDGDSPVDDDPKKEFKIPEGNDSVVPVSNQFSDTGVTFSALASTDTHVYVCTGANGMQIAAIDSDYTLNPIVTKGTFPGGPGCREISVAPDGVVFVTGLSSTEGAWIASMSSIPSAEGELPIDGSVAVPDALVEDILATDSHVYAVLGGLGLRIYGRNDGGLAEVGRLETLESAYGLAMWNGQLVVANGQNGLAVVDVSDPTQPQIAKSFDVYGTARRVAVRENIAWVATAGVGVGAYNLTSSKKKPREGSWPTHGSSQDLAVTPDGLVYVANWEDMVVLDGSNHKDIKFLGSEAVATPDGSSSHVVGVSAGEEVVFVSEWSGYWAYYYAAGKSAPDIRVSRTRVDFGVVKEGYKGKGILVDNLGDKDLEITDVISGNPQFTFDLDQSVIKPGDTGFLEVRFTVEDPEEESKTQLTLKTNDPDEAEIILPMTANVFDGIQLGGPFKQDPPLVFIEAESGNEVTVKQKHAGKVVLLAYFATW